MPAPSSDNGAPRSELQELQLKSQQVTDEVNLFFYHCKCNIITYVVYVFHSVAGKYASYDGSLWRGKILLKLMYVWEFKNIEIVWYKKQFIIAKAFLVTSRSIIKYNLFRYYYYLVVILLVLCIPHAISIWMLWAIVALFVRIFEDNN